MSRAQTAVQTAMDGERQWRAAQDRTRSQWNDVVRTHFDETAARRLATALRRTTSATRALDEGLAAALALLSA